MSAAKIYPKKSKCNRGLTKFKLNLVEACRLRGNSSAKPQHNGAIKHVTLNEVKGLVEMKTDLNADRKRLYRVKRAAAKQATERMLIIYRSSKSPVFAKMRLLFYRIRARVKEQKRI